MLNFEVITIGLPKSAKKIITNKINRQLAKMAKPKTKKKKPAKK